ncbi:17-beta-hydroxysteroid dehydrogenase type 3 isoform X2 [Brachyhypopomus gauderio]|uniref:17-beta-hydroxysteroid dehydrogenase type 3 isoform X2 n=1 Tax=Brachyhypopomus gauderio TaxID=698409 RepID=UPI0040437A4D
MALIEVVFILVGVCCVFFCGRRLARVLMVLFPKFWYPLPENFFTSMGKWAVITGGSEGIGRAYAQQLAGHGLNVVLISRSRGKLETAAQDIELTTGRKVTVISADFTKDDIYTSIEESISSLDVAILVNNVGILPSQIPCKLLETTNLEEKILQVINCNLKSMAKMCRLILPGMVERGRGIILNVSSGMAIVPFPLYTLYGATKVFIERFAQCLQAEYKSKGILVQTVSPFGVSTSMMGYQKEDLMTFSAEAFVKSSLTYLKAGDHSYGSVRHTILGSFFQNIPTWVLRHEAFHQSFKEFVKKRVGA